jgi:hypothetical protein
VESRRPTLGSELVPVGFRPVPPVQGLPAIHAWRCPLQSLPTAHRPARNHPTGTRAREDTGNGDAQREGVLGETLLGCRTRADVNHPADSGQGGAPGTPFTSGLAGRGSEPAFRDRCRSADDLEYETSFARVRRQVVDGGLCGRRHRGRLLATASHAS